MRVVVVKAAAKKPRLLSFHFFFLLSFFLEQWGRDRVQTRRVRRRCRHVQGQSSRRAVLRMRAYVLARACVCVVCFFRYLPPPLLGRVPPPPPPPPLHLRTPFSRADDAGVGASNKPNTRGHGPSVLHTHTSEERGTRVKNGTCALMRKSPQTVEKTETRFPRTRNDVARIS